VDLNAVVGWVVLHNFDLCEMTPKHAIFVHPSIVLEETREKQV
jgi:hypothetical protein